MKKIFSLILLNLSILLLSYVAASLIVKIEIILNWSNFVYSSITLVGIFIILAGLSIRVWATIAFYKNNLKILSLNPQNKFVQAGPYKYSRNPLYIGLILIYLGFTIYTGSYVGIISAIFFALFWNWVAAKEEKELAEKFGNDYLEYKNKVPRWI